VSFICFFAVIVANSGGPEGCLTAMIEQSRKACCCCPSDPFRLYKRVQFAVFQFLVFRPVVVVLGAVFVYLEVNAIFLVCQLVAAAMFVFGFGSLAIFCELSAATLIYVLCLIL
jgi:hypothetical protein